MIERFKPNLEVLPEEQKALWPMLSQLKYLGFVLYGGTALALQYGHRKSVDFDFFNHFPLNHDLIREALPILKDESKSIIRQREPNALTYEIEFNHKKVSVSFFGTLSFGRIGQPRLTDDGNLIVASVKDIFALKLKTIIDRASYKDYADIAELLRQGENLADGLSGTKTLYGSAFAPEIALRALNYYDDVIPAVENRDKKLLQKESKKMMDWLCSHDLAKTEIKNKVLSVDRFSELVNLKSDQKNIQERLKGLEK